MGADMLKVAVVEDEPDLREEFCEFLRLSGMEAVGLSGGRELDAHLKSHATDAVLLDINLPDDDGFSIAARLREAGGEQAGGTPSANDLGVVMVTSRAALDDRVRGLRMGADAYLVKPVDLQELVATLKSVCRRLTRAGTAVDTAAKTNRARRPVVGPPAGWSLGRLGWELTGPDGRAIALTAAEHDFLVRLAATPGRPVPRADLLGRCNDKDDGDLRRLDAVVRRLRRKVESDIGLPLPVRSVHGVGYAVTDTLGNPVGPA